MNFSWFKRAIAERNCALFEASLYPIKPELWSKTDRWVAKNQPDSHEVNDSIRTHMLVEDLIEFAFERSEDWRPEQPITDWIMSFVDEVFAACNPTFR